MPDTTPPPQHDPALASPPDDMEDLLTFATSRNRNTRARLSALRTALEHLKPMPGSEPKVDLHDAAEWVRGLAKEG